MTSLFNFKPIYQHLCVFQKVQFAFTLQANAILILFERQTYADKFKLELEVI